MNLKRSTVEDVKNRYLLDITVLVYLTQSDCSFKMHKEKKVVEKKEYSLAERLADAAEEEERMAAYSQQARISQ